MTPNHNHPPPQQRYDYYDEDDPYYRHSNLVVLVLFGLIVILTVLLALVVVPPILRQLQRRPSPQQLEERQRTIDQWLITKVKVEVVVFVCAFVAHTEFWHGFSPRLISVSLLSFRMNE